MGKVRSVFRKSSKLRHDMRFIEENFFAFERLASVPGIPTMLQKRTSMTLSNFIAFAVAMLVLAIVPGPGVIATVARSISGGSKRAAMMAGGIVLGDLVFLIAAIFGLASIAERMGTFFIFVKIAGGLYLIWIGASAFFSKSLGSGKRDAKQIPFVHSDFLTGLAITLGNPKVIVFYLSFLPTFMDLQSLSFTDTLLVALLVSTVLGAVLLGYIAAASSAKICLGSKSHLNHLRQASGVVLLGSGIFLFCRNQ